MGRSSPAAGSKELPVGREGASLRTSPVPAPRQRLTRWLRLALLWFSTPDALAGWIPLAVTRGWWITRREAVSALLASSPPFSTACVGVLLKKLTGLPLVLDFRDAWTLDPADPFGCLDGSFRAPISHRRRALLARLEAIALRNADEVLFTSDRTLQAYRSVYPELGSRGRVLYNGVDERDFDGPPDDHAGFALTYVGTLHHYQLSQAELVLRAFARLSHESPSDGLILRFFGHRAAPLDARLRSLAEELGVADRVVLEGPIPHARAISLMRARGVQLLFAGSSRFIRLTKISDCLATGRPLLALAASDSETAAHVRAGGSYGLRRLLGGRTGGPSEAAAATADGALPRATRHSPSPIRIPSTGGARLRRSPRGLTGSPTYEPEPLREILTAAATRSPLVCVYQARRLCSTITAMTRSPRTTRVLQLVRRHLLDALDERGLVLGLRLEFSRSEHCELRRFEESFPGPGEVLVESPRHRRQHRDGARPLPRAPKHVRRLPAGARLQPVRTCRRGGADVALDGRTDGRDERAACELLSGAGRSSRTAAG